MTHNEIDEFCEELASVLYRLNTPDFESGADTHRLFQLSLNLMNESLKMLEKSKKGFKNA